MLRTFNFEIWKLKCLGACPEDLYYKTRNMKQVKYTAAGGVVIYRGKVLVLNRPSRNEVRLPKGHLEEGEDFETAAKREVSEESGYANLNVLADLGAQHVEFSWEGKSIERTERYFLMSLEEKDFRSKGCCEEEFEPHWITFDEALLRLSFEAEREWIRRGKTVYTKRSGS